MWLGNTLEGLKARARRLKRDTYALYLAVREPGVPWYVKALGMLIVGYALSPIDLIPDFIPVLGYLDDLLVVPAGIALLKRLIPAEIMERCRERASIELEGTTLKSIPAAIVIGLIWLILAALVIRAVARAL